MKSPQINYTEFQKTLWAYYEQYGRHDLPWRMPEPGGSFDPYKILVSELMLQQTQVPRVLPKYQQFITRFPTLQDLAGASLSEVLKVWSGLGYNRRAKFLQEAAKTLITKDDLWQYEELVACKGIGPNTAAAVLVYSFNQPLVFIETNIRTVYIHHFFHDQTEIPDSDILALIEQTLDMQNPRLFYWALMDYGSHLKQTVGNLNKLSKTYAKQSPFHGSLRQIRGAVIRHLTTGDHSEAELRALIADERLPVVLHALQDEGLVARSTNTYSLSVGS